MKFFVAYVVDFQPYFWHDVNSQMVSHAKVEVGECEPMTFNTFQQAMKVMCTTRDRKRFFVQGCYAVLDEMSLPERYCIPGYSGEATKARVEGQVAKSKRKTKTLKNTGPVYCIRYTTNGNGVRWLNKSGDWSRTEVIKVGDKTLRGFKTKLDAQQKVTALGKVTPSIRPTATVLLIEDEFPGHVTASSGAETKEQAI